MSDEPKIERMSAETTIWFLNEAHRAMMTAAKCIAVRYGENNEYAGQLAGAARLIKDDWIVAIQKEVDTNADQS